MVGALEIVSLSAGVGLIGGTIIAWIFRRFR
jgi:hypothetical protein